ncbi:hypothetical protein TELCIR_04102 [Teladorsagia circumcincta]|uniref:Uncharacterized protein n=1 Tax=Teladorsagia circumcincta TaxID=45464 RepID=A0A2G9UUJ2_TELCI|nr:hypothetical protein TELCIR_04102 [Teladorsagia circumcincta]
MIGGILFTASAILALLHFLHNSPYSCSDAYPMPRRIQIFHVNRALQDKEGTKIRDSALYVIAQDYRGAEDIPFVDGSEQFLASLSLCCYIIATNHLLKAITTFNRRSSAQAWRSHQSRMLCALHFVTGYVIDECG